MGLAAGKAFRAQFWSFDVIFSIIIFSVAVTILTFTWFNLSTQLSVSSSSGSAIMQLQTQALAQSLLSVGSPANWQGSINPTNSTSWPNVSVGLAAAPGNLNLSADKVYMLMAMSHEGYQASKSHLGVAFDYFVNIRSNPSNGAGVNISIGEDPVLNRALTVYVQKRSAFMDGVPATVTVMLWTSTRAATS